MSGLLQDIRHTLRSLRSAPGFYGMVALTLAVGIGATTALFSVVKTVLLDPLPYPHSERLVVVARYPWIPAEIVQALKGSASFDGVAAYYPQPFAVTGAAEPLELEGAQVTPGFFGLFGTTMAQGRAFVPADSAAGAAPVAILSYGAWQRLYGGDVVLGRTIRVNGRAHEIVGVTQNVARRAHAES
ncbi:MAG TPA: ABC transporter permease [Longimicrobiales bacterium]|nr:ABC transporter permease [Longimicrobiales bacterium]